MPKLVPFPGTSVLYGAAQVKLLSGEVTPSGAVWNVFTLDRDGPDLYLHWSSNTFASVRWAKTVNTGLPPTEVAVEAGPVNTSGLVLVHTFDPSITETVRLGVLGYLNDDGTGDHGNLEILVETEGVTQPLPVLTVEAVTPSSADLIKLRMTARDAAEDVRLSFRSYAAGGSPPGYTHVPGASAFAPDPLTHEFEFARPAVGGARRVVEAYVTNESGLLSSPAFYQEYDEYTGVRTNAFVAPSTAPPIAFIAGDLWYVTDLETIRRWNGSAWIDIREQMLGDIRAALQYGAPQGSYLQGLAAIQQGEVLETDGFWVRAARLFTEDALTDLTPAEGGANVTETRTALNTSNVGGRTAGVVNSDLNAALASAAQAILDAAGAQATADQKIQTFLQASPPTAEGVGDLWADSDDDNKVYRWSGSAWVVVRDQGISQAIVAASTAQSTADGKITTFVQPSTSVPTAEGVGDYWHVTDLLIIKYWTGSAWIEVSESTLGALRTALIFGASGGARRGGSVSVSQGEFTDEFGRAHRASALFTSDGLTKVFDADTGNIVAPKITINPSVPLIGGILTIDQFPEALFGVRYDASGLDLNRAAIMAFCRADDPGSGVASRALYAFAVATNDTGSFSGVVEGALLVGEKLGDGHVDRVLGARIMALSDIDATGSISQLIGLQLVSINTGAGVDAPLAFGLLVQPVVGADLAFAIYTSEGKIRFGERPTFQSFARTQHSDGWEVILVKTIDQDNTTTSLANDTEFQFAVANGEVWLVELLLVYGGNGDFKLDFGLPTITGTWHYLGVNTAADALLLSTGIRLAAATSLGATVVAGTAGPTAGRVIWGQLFFTAGADGSVIMRFASNTVDTTATVRAGSQFRARRLSAWSSSLSQVGFRGYADDGNEAGATPKAAENTNWSQASGVPFRVRFVVDETSGNVETGLHLQLQFSVDGTNDWGNVHGASSVVKSAASEYITDGAATTRRLTSGTGTFHAGAVDTAEGIVGVDESINISSAGGLTEVEYCIEIVADDLTGIETVELRVVRSGGTLQGWTQIPSISV